MIDGYKTGFVTDPQGNRLLPITHINLVVDNDGRPISSIINQNIRVRKKVNHERRI